jgi:curved DNA-binding protein CbpA
MKNHYQTLGLREGASQEAIQEAYDRLSKELDPEQNDFHEFFLEEYALLQEAYDALTNNSNILPNTSQQKKPVPSSNTSLNKPDFEKKVKPIQDDKNFKSRILKNVFIYSIVVIIFILIAKQNYNSNSDSEPSTAIETTSLDTAGTDLDANMVSLDSTDFSNISVFQGNQLKNGSSPLDSCFGRGEYYGHATLTIKNGDFSDAIVCLYSVTEGKTIRNEYVQKNSSFTMSSIAEGDYKIRILSGNNWNPIDINSCGGKGKFESDVSFYEFDGTNFFQDSNGQYSTNTVTLYGVEGGTATSSSMSENDFFKPSP